MTDWFTDEQVEKAYRAYLNSFHMANFWKPLTDAEFAEATKRYPTGAAETKNNIRAALSAVNPYEWRSIVGSDIPEFERFRVWNGAGQFIAWMEDGVWVEALSGYDNPIKPTPTHFCALFFPSPEGDK